MAKNYNEIMRKNQSPLNGSGVVTFDEVLPKLSEIFERNRERIRCLGTVVVNRDLNGRVCLVTSETNRREEILKQVAKEIHDCLCPHAFSPERLVLFEKDIESFITGDGHYLLSDGIENVFVVDRFAVEGDWFDVSAKSTTVPRIVSHSIRGGVGRSTALALAAWSLAERGYRVMILDLDLGSPGLSNFLLSDGLKPPFGIIDWMVEDLVDNGDAVLDSMVSISDLPSSGEVLVVPAHGSDPGDYISKFGRIWMSKADADGGLESWSNRLDRLLKVLEEKWSPDVVLLDSSAGINECSFACLTDLGASLYTLFTVDDDSTWSGYKAMFYHLRRVGASRDIRKRLQVVGAMIPETGAEKYICGLQEKSWRLFCDELYDDAHDGGSKDGVWWFDLEDRTAPHYPWLVWWNHGFLPSQHSCGSPRDITDCVADAIDDLVEGIDLLISKGSVNE